MYSIFHNYFLGPPFTNSSESIPNSSKSSLSSQIFPSKNCSGSLSDLFELLGFISDWFELLGFISDWFELLGFIPDWFELLGFIPYCSLIKSANDFSGSFSPVSTTVSELPSSLYLCSTTSSLSPTVVGGFFPSVIPPKILSTSCCNLFSSSDNSPSDVELSTTINSSSPFLFS